jgi:hypothetical protein
MKFYAFATAVLVGLTAPCLTYLASPAVAQSPTVTKNIPLIGTFTDNNWMVTVSEQNGVYRYHGYNLKTSKSIDLLGATITKQGNKRLYTWNNNGTRYRVTWQPQDQDYVRVQVIGPQRTEVLNRLLARQEGGC